MLFFCHGLHYQINDKYPKLYSGGSGENNANMGYEIWAMAVAESGIAGELKNIDNMYLWDFLEILNYIVIRNANHTVH